MNQQGPENLVSIKPSYYSKVDIVSEELSSCFCLGARIEDDTYIFIGHPAIVFNKNGFLGDKLFCINYGSNSGDLIEIQNALSAYLQDFLDLFSKEDLNDEVLSQFLVAYKRAALNNKDSKSLAIETLVIYEEKDYFEFCMVDFRGDRLSPLDQKGAFKLIGAYNHKNREVAIDFIEGIMKSSPSPKIIQEKLEELFGVNVSLINLSLISLEENK